MMNGELERIMCPSLGRHVDWLDRIFPCEADLIAAAESPYADAFAKLVRYAEKARVELPAPFCIDEEDEAARAPDTLADAYAALRRAAERRSADPAAEEAFQARLTEVLRLEHEEAERFEQAFDARWGRHLRTMDEALTRLQKMGYLDAGPSTTDGASGDSD